MSKKEKFSALKPFPVQLRRHESCKYIVMKVDNFKKEMKKSLARENNKEVSEVLSGDI